MRRSRKRFSRTQSGLEILQDANCKLSREHQRIGPQGYRSSLRQESGPSRPTDADVAHALVVLSYLQKIRCEQDRMAVALAAHTVHCDPVHTVRSIAKMMGCGSTTVQRRLDRGIAVIYDDIEREHLLAA